MKSQAASDASRPLFRELSHRSSSAVAKPERIYPLEELREELVRHGRRLLMSAAATEALDHLLATDGYTLALLQKTEWLFWPPAAELESHLLEIFPDARNQIAGLKLDQLAVEALPLVLPLRDAQGIINGFIKRSDLDRPLPLQPFDIQARLPAAIPLFRPDLPSSAKDESSLIVVITHLAEAVYLSAAGMKNLAAGGDGFLTPSQVQVLLNGGWKEVCLALTGAAREASENGSAITRKALQDLENSGLRVYVVDPEWLQQHNGPAHLVRSRGLAVFQNAINKAARALSWQFQDILKRYDLTTDRGLDLALDEFTTLYQSLDDPVARRSVLQKLQEVLGFNEAEVRAALRAKHKRDLSQKAREALQETIARLKTAADTGNITVAELELVRGIHDLRQFQALDVPAPYCELAEDLQHVPDALRTGYATLDQRVGIPADGLTVVTAPPHHGKDILLLNLLYNLLRRYPQKAFFYFGYTESRRQMALKLVMRIAGEVLDARFNMDAYARYLKDGRDDLPAIDHAHALYLNYARTGRLLISDRHYSAGRLASVMRFFATNRSIGAVIIDDLDYIPPNDVVPSPAMTALPSTPWTVCNELVAMAQALHAPVILGTTLTGSSPPAAGPACPLRLTDIQPAPLTSLADVVLGVYSPDQPDSNHTGSEHLERNLNTSANMEIHILSQRRGNTGGQVSLSLNLPVFTLTDEPVSLEPRGRQHLDT